MKKTRITEAEAISKLADAISALAAAIANQKPPPSAPAAIPDPGNRHLVETMAFRTSAPPLTSEQILDGIRSIFNAPKLGLDTDINSAIEGGPARLVAMWEDIDDWPAFRERRLMLGPNDLRYVSTVAQLVGVIAWGLKNALRR
jgi:hypothetical protein